MVRQEHPRGPGLAAGKSNEPWRRLGGVLLVSQHFLDRTSYDAEELPFLLRATKERGVTLLWVLVNHCPYEATPLAAIQACARSERATKRQERGQPAENPQSRRHACAGTGGRELEAGNLPHAEEDEAVHGRWREGVELERDDFLDRVAQVFQLRHAQAKIDRRRDPATRLAYLRIFLLPEGRFFVTRPVAAFQHGIVPETLAEFVQLVDLVEYRAADPGVIGEIVYGGDAWARRTWSSRRGLNHRVLLTSFVEHQGHHRLSGRTSGASRNGSMLYLVYPRRLYVPQRGSAQKRLVDRTDVPHALNAGRGTVGHAQPAVGAGPGRFWHRQDDSLAVATWPVQLADAGGGLDPILIEMRALEKGHLLEELIALHLAKHQVEKFDLAAFRYMLAEGRISAAVRRLGRVGPARDARPEPSSILKRCCRPLRAGPRWS